MPENPSYPTPYRTPEWRYGDETCTKCGHPANNHTDTRCAAQVRCACTPEGAPVSDHIRLIESAKDHIERKHEEAKATIRAEWDSAPDGGRSMPSFSWSDATVWLDDWQPDA